MVERTTFDVQRPPGDADVRAGTPADETDSGDVPVAKTGTTTVAIAADDAVVLAADQRASLGGRFTANKHVQKVDSVHRRAALAMSGSVGAVQDFAATLEAEAALYAARRGDAMSMRALATVGGNLVRGVPAQLLLGGVDEDGPAVYELDGGGAVMPTDYGAAGSGMQVAYGVLEGRAEAVADADDARSLAVDAVAAASERDTASGNGAHVATVTDDGVAIEALEPDVIERSATARGPGGGAS